MEKSSSSTDYHPTISLQPTKKTEYPKSTYQRIGNKIFQYKRSSLNLSRINKRIVHVDTPHPKCWNSVEKTALDETPAFNQYRFEKHPKYSLTSLNIRPINLLLEALFPNQKIAKRPFLSSDHNDMIFHFTTSPENIRKTILERKNDEVISVKAGKEWVKAYSSKSSNPIQMPLSKFFGENTFRISIGEIKQILLDQKIYLSKLLPKEFYLGLKTALEKDECDELPGNPFLKTILNGNAGLPCVQAFLMMVEINPNQYGFTDDSAMSFKNMKELSLYQVGSMVIKTDTYHPMIENGYLLTERHVGDSTEINLISCCGIRDFHSSRKIPGNRLHEINRNILKETFRTTLKAAGTGYLILPALGMGVWGGDPDVYWRALFDAISESGQGIEKIFVNPGHQVTRYGKFSGAKGEEFQQILNTYLLDKPIDHPLRKIVNLSESKADLLLFAKNLKQHCPHKQVSLVNASDPDVTLGSLVGEYANDICHPPTTEENFAVAGTLLFGFERMTRILEEPARLIQ